MVRSAVVAFALLVSLGHPGAASCQDGASHEAEVPAPRIYHSLVYVEPLGGLLLTGGHSKLGWEADVRDMWVWSSKEQTWQAIGTYEASPQPSERPGGEEAQSPAYDEQSKELIAFNSYGETWALDVQHVSWRRLSPERSPTTRCGHGMTYDAESDRVILFGGFGCMTPNDSAHSETWAFDFESGQWTQMHPGSNPSPRMYFGMAYDRALDRVVLWGGRTLQPISDRAVWLYDFNHDKWESVDVGSGPSQVLAYPGMVYRPDTDDLIVFGGAALRSPFVGDVSDTTWRLDLRRGSWERLSASQSPPAVAVHALGYDPIAKAAVLFGGEIDQMYSNRVLVGTWLYDSRSGTWKQAHFR